ncbi:hypothetical protein [Actinokineospora iranica]|uniref:Uncharacterized protein n=1 Tax=Actinokineospora iranica TaxID=1271860 RepID=A0A1G6JW73_9PSEU|nr:hypothetical protein [Actinokineospora iranica]SDC23002.1 hypothetical protein SAMN05216174_101592 [Actinokineospora iranica]
MTDLAHRRRHPGWLALAGFCVVFAAFEAVKHRGWVIPAAAVGAALPFVPVTVLRHWAPPTAVLVAFTVLPETNTQAAPGFTLGLAWLAHVAIQRGTRSRATAAQR